MDRIAIIPENDLNHDILHVFTESFQDVVCAQKFPLNTAANLLTYTVDSGNVIVENSSLAVEKYANERAEEWGTLRAVEKEIMEKHAMQLIINDETQTQPCLVEQLKLKRQQIFQNLNTRGVETFGLLQKSDLLPHKIAQFLDFRINTDLHTCQKPCPKSRSPISIKETQEEVAQLKRKRTPTGLKQKGRCASFAAEPSDIIFENFDANKVYKRKFKLRNTTGCTQAFTFAPFPKESPFTLQMVAGSTRLAAGMFADFLLTYKPEVNLNTEQAIAFKCYRAEDCIVKILCRRRPPKLVCYCYNALGDSVQKPFPGSTHFNVKRSKALNFTIDCGTCLLGTYSLMTLVMENVGQKGRFFITTESEWFFEEIFEERRSRILELQEESFSIFPSYFEIGPGDIGEIHILFLPEHEGLHANKVFFICDNNSYQGLEIIGDCVVFNSNNLRVDAYLDVNSFCYENRLIKIAAEPQSVVSLILTVTNNNSLYLNFCWKITKREATDKKLMDLSWVQIVNKTSYLAPFSETDFLVVINAATDVPGLYSIFLNFYIKNIPIISVPPDKNFEIIPESERDCCCFGAAPPEETTPDEYDLRRLRLNEKCADVHICQMEIELYVRPSSLGEDPKSCEHRCKCENVEEVEIEIAKTKFSNHYLNLGIIPRGIEVSKTFTIESLTTKTFNWILVEIQCSPDMKLNENNIVSDHIKRWRGAFRKRGQKRKLTYKVLAKEPVRWLSLLVLFITSDSGGPAIDSICVVTYEISKIDVILYTPTCDLPLLCPRQLLYVEVPVVLTINVHNVGISTGCFYFLKPVGKDAAKIRVRFRPQSGILTSGQCVSVNVELTGLEPGIHEKIHVPCFTGDEEQISLKIICPVDGINLYFHLPRKEGYSKILWPPRENGNDWRDLIKGYGEFEGASVPDIEVEEPCKELLELLAGNSVALTYPTVELRQIPARTPVTLKFYIENISVMKGEFGVEATNFGLEEDCKRDFLIKTKMKKPQEYWESSCMMGYGIAVSAQPSSGDFIEHETIEVTLQVYSNTWGIYLEEIIVEINDLTPFCFNLLVVVVGLPLEFPIAVNTTLDEPTLKLGTIAYASGVITRTIKVVNVSSVPVHLTWHVFNCSSRNLRPFNLVADVPEEKKDEPILELFQTRDYFGEEPATPLQVEPGEICLKKQSSATMKLTMDVDQFPSSLHKTVLRYYLVGYMRLRDEDRFKESYFKRRVGSEAELVKLVVVATLEMPLLRLESTTDNTISVFVNDILLKRIEDPQISLNFRNNDDATVRFSMNVDEPFSIIEVRTSDNLVCDPKFVELRRKQCVKSVRLSLNLHYPHIEVKPSYLKFGHVLLFNTQKMLLSIYNLTGGIVRLEIYKTTSTAEFTVNPNIGEIPGTTGQNNQFIDVAVYFTPKECKYYLETLRVITNIPHYFIDVPVCGFGSINERFAVN